MTLGPARWNGLLHHLATLIARAFWALSRHCPSEEFGVSPLFGLPLPAPPWPWSPESLPFESGVGLIGGVGRGVGRGVAAAGGVADR